MDQINPQKIAEKLNVDPSKIAEKLKIDPSKIGEIAEKLNLDPAKIAQRFNVDATKAEPVLKTTRDWMLMIGAALYVLSPLDLIPEAVFGAFGLVDDAIVMLLAALWYLSKYNQAKKWTNKFKGQ